MKNMFILLVEYIRNIAVILVLLFGLFILSLIYYPPLKTIVTDMICESSSGEPMDESFFAYTYNDEQQNFTSKAFYTNYDPTEIVKRKIILPLKSSGLLIVEPSEIVIIQKSGNDLLFINSSNDTISLSSSRSLDYMYSAIGEYKMGFFKNRDMIINYDHISKIYTKPIPNHIHNKSNYFISTSTNTEVNIPQSNYEKLKNIFKP